MMEAEFALRQSGGSKDAASLELEAQARIIGAEGARGSAADKCVAASLVLLGAESAVEALPQGMYCTSFWTWMRRECAAAKESTSISARCSELVCAAASHLQSAGLHPEWCAEGADFARDLSAGGGKKRVDEVAEVARRVLRRRGQLK